MKRNILHIIIALAIIFASPNVYADGNKDKKDKKSIKARTEKVSERFTSALDTRLELENWMVNLDEFTEEEMFYEAELHLEDWMMKPFVSNEKESFQEEELVLEDWMLKF